MHHFSGNRNDIITFHWTISKNRSTFSPQQIESARYHIEIYKTFIRPFLPTCRVYHHTPVLPP